MCKNEDKKICFAEVELNRQRKKGEIDKTLKIHVLKVR